MNKKNQVFVIATLCLVSGLALFGLVNAGPTTFPALQSVIGLTNPSLAYGLSGVNDYAPTMVFIDIMKNSRPWCGQGATWCVMSNQQLIDGGYLDANGYPTVMPPGVTHITAGYDWSAGGGYGAAATRAGDYVLTYDGVGDVQIAGGQNVVRTPGRITFTLSGNAYWHVGIHATDANDHVRNISVVKEENVALHEAGALFNPEWIELVKDARQVRFMDWNATTNSDWETWSDHTIEDYYTWAEGVPVSVMVKLANEIGADPWFNIPFHADDNYVTQFATYVKANLDPALLAHVELSNEVWNFSFQQSQDAIALAAQEFGVSGGAGWVNYYGKRASEVMKIWTDVYGSEAPTRLKRVAGVFGGWSVLTEEILLAPMWQTADPVNYVAPHTYFDAIAATTYFGGFEITDEAVRNQLLSVIADPQIDDFEWNETYLRSGSTTQGSIAEVFHLLQIQKDYADDYNLDLIAYEGGQHVHHSAFVSVSQQDLNALQNHFTNFVRSSEMAGLYQTMWDGWEALGDGPFMQFTDIYGPTVYGSWGLRASITDNPPRALLLDSLNQATPAWWENRGGIHFQQGRTVVGSGVNNTLAGTQRVDWIIAEAGDDTIYPGPGNDGVNGGSGTDTVLLSGTRGQYSVTQSGAGYTVTGPEGVDYLFAVEFVEFTNGDQIQLSNEAFTPGAAASSTPSRTPSPLNTNQIHSGHSLTDGIFQGSWPGLIPNLISAIDPTAYDNNGLNGNIARSTIPGSDMAWRWNNPPCCGARDARHDIEDYQLLSITENNFISPESLFPPGVGWESGFRLERRAQFSVWVNHARQNGNNGDGAEVLLYTVWPAFPDFAPAANWRARLAANEVEWLANADNAEALAPAGTEIFIIPGNALMMQLWDDAEAGDIPGIANGNAWMNSSRWWSDNVHPASLGGLALAYLHLAVIHHLDPRDLPYTGLGLTITPTAQEAAYIQNLVWDLVNTYERAGFTSQQVQDPAPVVTFSASPTSITSGNSTTLTWSTTNATACTASNGWSGSRATSGSLSVSPTSNTTYTLTCTGAGGSDVESRSVTVTPIPTPEVVPPSTGGGGGGGGGSSKKPKKPVAPITIEAFSTGDIIEAKQAIDVRNKKFSVIGKQKKAAKGTISDGTIIKNGSRSYIAVIFNTGVSGLVETKYLTLKTKFIGGVSTPTAPKKVSNITSATDQVWVKERVNVRLTPNGRILALQEVGTQGSLITIVPGVQDGYTWVYVDFKEGQDGYVAMPFLSDTEIVPTTNTVQDMISALRAEVSRLMSLLGR